tara:strand:- start:3603 stop:3824 length:222 start_codon:yes stop_codon:yes gene_type:complete
MIVERARTSGLQASFASAPSASHRALHQSTQYASTVSAGVAIGRPGFASPSARPSYCPDLAAGERAPNGNHRF